jgi:ATF/CREB family transcription factor
MGIPPPADSTKNVDSKSPVPVRASPPNATGILLFLPYNQSNLCRDAATDSRQDGSIKADTTNPEPLAPPPRLGVTAPTVGHTPDYFSVPHASHLSYETNPFEHSFAGGNGANGGGLATPGGTKLPSVAALTSPSGGLGGQTPTFWGSLRSGPLSPAMLSGPQKDDYFSDGHHLRGGFPTPNESSLRSGLTPGGGGSMFPEPSPNTQAFISQSLSGVATPSTLDFHRTAMSAAAAQKRDAALAHQNITSQPQDPVNGMDVKPPSGQFDQHDANDAANGLFLLAQARSGPQQTSHYTIAPQIPVHAHPQPVMQMGGQPNQTSPNMGQRNNNGSISTASGRQGSEMSGMSEDNEQQSRPNTRGKGKRNTTQINQTNGRRKADDTPSKGPANKKGKANSGHAMSAEPQSEEEPDMTKDEYNANGKKMTDEEKRKNFLERNR